MYLNICTIGVTLIMYQGIAHSGREVAADVPAVAFGGKKENAFTGDVDRHLEGSDMR
jgi:hypothetical protein